MRRRTFLKALVAGAVAPHLLETVSAQAAPLEFIPPVTARIPYEIFTPTENFVRFADLWLEETTAGYAGGYWEKRYREG